MEYIKIAERQLNGVIAVRLGVSPLIYVAVFYWQGPTALLQISENLNLYKPNRTASLIYYSLLFQLSHRWFRRYVSKIYKTPDGSIRRDGSYLTQSPDIEEPKSEGGTFVDIK